MKTADDVGGGDEAKTRPQGWKILLSLNKQSIDASNIFVNCMRDLLGPSCRDRIVNVQSSLVKTHSKEMQSTKTCLETLENTQCLSSVGGVVRPDSAPKSKAFKRVLQLARPKPTASKKGK